MNVDVVPHVHSVLDRMAISPLRHAPHRASPTQLSRPAHTSYKWYGRHTLFRLRHRGAGFFPLHTNQFLVHLTYRTFVPLVGR